MGKILSPLILLTNIFFLKRKLFSRKVVLISIMRFVVISNFKNEILSSSKFIIYNIWATRGVQRTAQLHHQHKKQHKQTAARNKVIKPKLKIYKQLKAIRWLQAPHQNISLKPLNILNFRAQSLLQPVTLKESSSAVIQRAVSQVFEKTLKFLVASGDLVDKQPSLSLVSRLTQKNCNVWKSFPHIT